MKKVNLEKLYTEGFEYKDTSWKAQKTKHLNELNIENAKDVFYVEETTANAIVSLLKKTKAKSSVAMKVVLSNYLTDKTTTPTKATKKETPPPKQYVDKGLLDKVVKLSAENLEMGFYISMLEKLIDVDTIPLNTEQEKKAFEVVREKMKRIEKIKVDNETLMC